MDSDTQKLIDWLQYRIKMEESRIERARETGWTRDEEMATYFRSYLTQIRTKLSEMAAKIESLQDERAADHPPLLCAMCLCEVRGDA